MTVVGLGRSGPLAAYTHALAPGAGPAPLPASLPRPDPARYRYEAADLLDEAALFAALERARPALVIHAAGLCHHGAPAELRRNNPMATAALLRALGRMASPPRLLLVSSGAVYGAARGAALHESSPTDPASDYARSKLLAEQVAAHLAAERKLPLLIGRVFNVVGPGQPVTYLAGSLSHQLAGVALGLVPPRVEVGPLTSTRDLIDVMDAGAALWRIALQAEAGAVINVASGRETPMIQLWDGLVYAARRAGAPEVEVVARPAPPGDVSRQVADVTRLRGLGVSAPRPLQQSLSALFDWSLTALRASHGG